MMPKPLRFSVVIASSLLLSAAVFAESTSQPATRPASKPTSTASLATTFPTPAELIARMRARRQEQSALPHVAYFDLSRPVTEKPAGFSLFGDEDAVTLRSLLDRLRQARNDKKIRAVLVTMGADTELSLAQAQELRDTLADITRAGKQTFVFADAYDTAGYLAASGASHICMLEGGEIMIPGVGMEAMFARGLLDKVGVKADYIQIGEYKGADEEYTRTEASDELRGEMNKLADQLYRQIVEGISLSRNLSTSDVRAIVDDAMFTGLQAKERGLVDHLIDEDGLRDLIASEIGGGQKKIELIHDYGKPQHESMDLSNPFALLSSLSRRPEPSNKPKIALVYVDGVISDGDGGDNLLGGDVAGSDELRQALRQASRDENTKAIVIRIDSPGGSALASEVIWQAARRAAEKKPVIVSVGGMAASGGYYIASAGDRIFADPAAIVGSIGVVGGKFVWKDLFAKLGLNTETFSKGRNADLFSSSQPFNERQRKMVTSWMKATYDQFTQRIMTTRSQKISHIDDVARGRIFSAKQGKDLGLVDEIGGLQQALSYTAKKVNLKEGEYDVKVLPAARTLADYLTGGAEASTPVRPKVSIGAASIMDLLDGSSRRMLGQQLQALQLLQRHPVMLVAPYAITLR